jgi:hypothetical protein
VKRDITPNQALAEAKRRWPKEAKQIYVRIGDGPPKDEGRAWRTEIERRNRARRERLFSINCAAEWWQFLGKELERWIKSSIENRCEVIVNRGWCVEVRVWGPTFRDGFERIDRGQAAKLERAKKPGVESPRRDT